MAKGRDRPRREPKRKPKEKSAKIQPGASGLVVPSYEPPTRQVEVIKPKRKPREPQEEE
jgi:hypothetical protein